MCFKSQAITCYFIQVDGCFGNATLSKLCFNLFASYQKYVQNHIHNYLPYDLLCSLGVLAIP